MIIVWMTWKHNFYLPWLGNVSSLFNGFEVVWKTIRKVGRNGSLLIFILYLCSSQLCWALARFDKGWKLISYQQRGWWHAKLNKLLNIATMKILVDRVYDSSKGKIKRKQIAWGFLSLSLETDICKLIHDLHGY